MISRYFPTDELENVPDRPEVAAARAQAQTVAQPLQIGEETGLPFIGYTYTRLYVTPPLLLKKPTIADLTIAIGSVAKEDCKWKCLLDHIQAKSVCYLSILHLLGCIVF